ncbi:hypothetical protein Glove_9g41 [Diversispora epigaea]|uniref:Elongation factor 1 beta central acidic region eukaryote domain-containing protein n=1 Tax=Diversispora epigaea TaxID=1348612 RepID=A0A397JQD7_9GLOM|nr:hypothetical protein Glove_9g41 [Diversispora epigaea]
MSQNLPKLLKKSVDISFLKEKYNIRLSRLYKEQTSAPQTVHFSKELESTIPETVDELKTENRKLKEEIAELKRQNSQMEIDFEEKLEKSQENINQMKEEIDFLANINQQFGAENNQLIKNLDRFRKYRIPESISVRSSPGNSGTKSEIIPSKRPKGQKLKSKKIAKTNKGKRVFGNDSEEEDTESDDEKNEKGARNEMKTIIKTIDSEFSLNYDQTFTSANNCEIRRKLIPELQKSLAPKFRPSVTQLTKWLNSIHKSRRATARMCNSGKLLKDLCRVHVNNRQNNKKICRIKAAKELFRKNDPNITDYDKESLLRISSPGNSGTKSEIIPSKRPKGQKLKSKKIAKTNKGKRVFGNDSEEEDTESDDEKNEKGARNEMKTIIKTIDSEFSLNYDQTFTSANNCEIRRKLIPELQKSLAPKFRPSVTQLTKWLNSIHKSRRATARMCNSGKLLKDLCRVHVNNRQNNKKICRIKAAKELFRKNDPNITDYDKESLLRMLVDRAFHSPEMSDTDEEDRSKTVVNTGTDTTPIWYPIGIDFINFRPVKCL